MKLPLKIDINSYGDVFILDNDNNYVTHVIRKENAEEIIKRVNEYENLKKEIEELKQKVQDLDNEIYFMINGSP